MNQTIPMVLVTAVMWMAPASYLAIADETTPRVPEANVEPKLTTDEAVRVLERSDDAAELEGAALSLVRAEDDNALKILARFLTKRDGLQRLDPEDVYRLSHHKLLRLFRVVDAIGAVATKEAEAVLLGLANHELYQRDGGRPHRLRHTSLIVAAGGIDEPSDALVEFLEEQVVAGRGFAVVSLGRMRSDRAHDVIVKRIRSDDYLTSWFDLFIRVRNNPNVVNLHRRLIEKEAEKIANDWFRNFLVQSMLRPEMVWGDPGAFITSPPREEASTEVLRELLEIADIVLKREDLYEPRTLEDARSGREEIKNILADRKKNER